MTQPSALRCPRCDASTSEADRYCEECGTQLHDDIDATTNTRDRRELDVGRAGAVSDRGLAHHRNEDACYLDADDDRVVAVVCDGVSSAVAPDVAARVAADAAGAVLRDGLSTYDTQDAMREAMAAASRAVLAIPWAPSRERTAPSCTLVAAVITQDAVTIGSVGDSRAYWIDAEGAQRLTHDDSWAEEQVTAGMLNEAEANADPRAHVITAWLGADAPPEPSEITTFQPPRPGWLVLCTDGLWNYAPTASEFASLLQGAGDPSTPLTIARAFTDFALEAGGRDNITVTVAAIGDPTTDHEEQP